jgi:hypothetical protein
MGIWGDTRANMVLGCRPLGEGKLDKDLTNQKGMIILG